MCEPGIPNLEKELYYLVSKFLEKGPCKEAAKVLQKEIKENKLVIPRIDWKGSTHARKLENYDQLNSHIPPDYLLQLAQRLNSLVDTCFPASIKSKNSLLQRGTLSLLRNDASTLQELKELLATSRHAACWNNSSRLLPSTLKHTSIVPTLNGQYLNGLKKSATLAAHCNVFSKLSMHKRTLGHLASVYCVIFDQTGGVIITGADDNLVKVWSSYDGRLVETFRGHSGQITDIAVNKENTFIASGSLDKTIRVWNLRDTHPVAVLQGHTGMITSLQFCPSANPDKRYLMSTGGDGNVCFWMWDPKEKEFSLTPNKFNEKSRPGAQMLCSSFTPGGSFLVTGSSDNFIRIYQLYPEPEKIAELPNHVDHVDSILYNNIGDRFLSGSRDGTAMIWYHKNDEWHAKCLDASSRLKGDPKLEDEMEAKVKLKVTMICWNINNQYVITAGTDHILRVWNSYTAEFLHTLKGHTDEVYILEAHPKAIQILLSAGHDGNIIIWDIVKCVKIKVFFNMLEGQGHGAIFDCKFSPNGLQFTATDSHGHLLIFGFGSDERYQRVPYEQFFHTDYRPIIRDANNYVLDEQTQTAPHLMPPPFLVDIDGNPHPSNYQMLIPGRNTSNLPQLRVEEPSVDLPPLLAEIEAAEAERNLLSPGIRRRHHSIDAGLMSPGGAGVGLRESGDVEGVRQHNNYYISGDITDADEEVWRNRTIICANKLFNECEDEFKRFQQGEDEINAYLKEKKKKKRSRIPSDVFKTGDGNIHTLRSGHGRGRGRTRQARVRPQIMYVRPSALRTLEYLQLANAEDVVVIGQTEDSSESEPEDWQGESSDSTDDSDWVLHPTKQKNDTSEKATRGRHKKRTMSSEEDDEVDVIGGSVSTDESDHEEDQTKSTKSSNNEDTEDDDNHGDDNNETSKTKNSKGKQRSKKRKLIPPLQREAKKLKKEIKTKKPVPSLNDTEAYLQFYQPPEWLLSVETHKFPYFPQIGDEVYYLRQGHHLYVLEVIKQNEYDIHEGKQVYKRYDFAPAELCKLVGISYDVGPPKMCSLKLELIGKKRSTGGKRTITVRFHDMPHVVDFLVLKHIYEKSLQQNWQEGDRFRCLIDDIWYFGTIIIVSPYHEEFLTSSFLSLIVKWDSGDEERLSPWDLEQISEGDLNDSMPLVGKDKQLYEYIPTDRDWPYEDMDDLITRASAGLMTFSDEKIAEPFAYPVNVVAYPTYWSFIAFPTDLQTIRTRLQNRFYRRIDALLWEVRQLKSNAIKFNEQGSSIVLHAAYVVKLLCKFLKDPTIKDILTLHREVEKPKPGKIYYDEGGDSEEEEEEEEDEEMDEGMGASSSSAACSRNSGSSIESWTSEAKSVLEFISAKDDAQPFREAVDIETVPDYLDLISEPMDISIIRHRLDSNQYDNDEAFIRDFQLIFKNSKKYNTDRRSMIYKMTLRLSTLFETRCENIRKKYVLPSNNNVHWTRGRTRKQINTHRVDDTVKNHSLSPCLAVESNAAGTSFNIDKFVIKRPTRSTTRLGHPNIEKLSHTNNSVSSSSETFSESEEEIRDSSASESEPTPNKSPEKPPQKMTRNSSRVRKKKREYGFESDDDEINSKQKKQKIDLRSKRTLRGRSSKTIQNSKRSARSRTAVNYCEDIFDDFDMVAEDDNDNEIKKSNSDNDSSSDEDEMPTPVVGVSRFCG